MGANYTRRMDLLVDAGVVDPEGAMQALVELAIRAGAVNAASAEPGALAASPLPVDQAISQAAALSACDLDPGARALVASAVEWLFERNGDLAGLFWLCRQVQQGDRPSTLAAIVFALGERLWAAGRHAEAAALLRFFVDMQFDWGALYTQQGIAYGFFTPREPNPLVWKLLSLAEQRGASPQGRSVRVLELGCGIGNDAVGLMSAPFVSAYEGVDISDRALQRQRERTAEQLAERPDLHYLLTQADFLTVLRKRVTEPGPSANMVYSYSSLHYFNSEELREIMSLVRRLLPPTTGYFAFGIKGKDSIWDGQGLPLYRPDVWLNLDGQSRWFPSRGALSRLLDILGFEVLVHEIHEHWSYSERGKVDFFHYVICTPRP